MYSDHLLWMIVHYFVLWADFSVYKLGASGCLYITCIQTDTWPHVHLHNCITYMQIVYTHKQLSIACKLCSYFDWNVLGQ